MKLFSRILAGPFVIGAFAFLIWQERRRPLRRRVEDDFEHGVRNLAVASTGALAVLVFEMPVIQPLARLVEKGRLGLLGGLWLPKWAKAGIALLLMDYTFYLWHVLNHRAPFLWRFHAVHHLDRDLDATTALRFHFGEMLLSIPFRAAQVRLIGITPASFALWQVWFAVCVMFHHSNLRLPLAWERWANRVLVTPRMHGIHHSQVEKDTNSNWSSGLTIWDWLHGTLRLDVPQNEIVIGVPAFDKPDSVHLLRSLSAPFRKQPEYFRAGGRCRDVDAT